MNSVQEIEQALKQLPTQERWEIARWLLEDLQETTLNHAEAKVSGDNGERTLPLPDYSSHRRRIFGSKVLPNMVLAARAEERWWKTYADTSFLFSLCATEGNSSKADAWRLVYPANAGTKANLTNCGDQHGTGGFVQPHVQDIWAWRG